jgi:hypothetical protein
MQLLALVAAIFVIFLKSTTFSTEIRKRLAIRPLSDRWNHTLARAQQVLELV